MRCENVANGLQQRGEHSANTLLTDCGYVANELQQCGEHSANTWRTDYNNVATFGEYSANGLQQCNIQKTKTILLQLKNPLFARQKPYFCTSKTILL